MRIRRLRDLDSSVIADFVAARCVGSDEIPLQTVSRSSISDDSHTPGGVPRDEVVSYDVLSAFHLHAHVIGVCFPITVDANRIILDRILAAVGRDADGGVHLREVDYCESTNDAPG